ncbi:MAG: histidine--tRNA ligase [bacterium]|nr:histidine--tRNA ligase [bacterium]
MATKISARSAAGTRDFLPEEMNLRQSVRRVIEETFALYGFQPLETPAIERLDVLTGKYGEEADRLIFKILKRGEDLKSGLESGELSDLALRYDLTVPLARVVANNRDKLVFPFKRYQIQPVWRAERPQKGRYREFYQCDADIVGTASVTADAEIIALSDDILQRLKIPSYRIQVNHRLLLQAIGIYSGVPQDRFIELCITIDKLDKIGSNGVITELKQKEFPQRVIEKTIGLILNPTSTSRDGLAYVRSYVDQIPEGIRAISEIESIFQQLENLGLSTDRIIFTPHLARGLDYYTGPIFETIIEEPRLGSITGGGRYDGLIGIFSGESIPATGTSIGIERIFDVIKALDLSVADSETKPRIIVAVFSEETRPEALRIVAQLRHAGIPAEVYLDEARKLGKQFSYADRKGIRFVIIAGPDEISRGEVTLKDLVAGEQKTLASANLIETLLHRMK